MAYTFKDNAFGYLKTAKGQGKLSKVEDTEDMSVEAEEAGNTEAEEIQIEATNDNGTKTETNTNTTRKGTRVKTIARTSPLATSILVGLRKNGKGIVENYVALTEGTPSPIQQNSQTPP